MNGPLLILASASPRRQMLLHDAGFDFLLRPADIDESVHPPCIGPGELAEYLAVAKAAKIAGEFPDDVVIAADTVVAAGPLILGKPVDAEDARRMLGRLSGSEHAVISGVAVERRASGYVRHCQVRSLVQMRPLTDAEITDYVAGGLWQGKAGGYGIQDPDPFVIRLSGSLTNIVGLPMDETLQMLADAGVQPAHAPSPFSRRE